MVKPKTPVKAPERRHNAGILDIRNIIGALLGLYGLILLTMAVFTDNRGTLTEDVDANLWAGLALVAAAAAFIIWARVRPVKVPEVPESEKG